LDFARITMIPLFPRHSPLRFVRARSDRRAHEHREPRDRASEELLHRFLVSTHLLGDLLPREAEDTREEKDLPVRVVEAIERALDPLGLLADQRVPARRESLRIAAPELSVAGGRLRTQRRRIEARRPPGPIRPGPVDDLPQGEREEPLAECRLT